MAAFERELGGAVGSPNACLTSSGTAALMCCYAGLDLGPGDEVIIPGYTWVASALAPLHMGVIPVIVDIDASLTLDLAAFERAITPRTRAINPIHMVGLANDMDGLRALARRHNLFIIEDACQADGGYWSDGTRLGAIGDMGADSFNHYKVLSAGDGGAFFARDRAAYERGLIFHDGGCIFRPHGAQLGVESLCGINLRGNEILAAILRANLRDSTASSPTCNGFVARCSSGSPVRSTLFRCTSVRALASVRTSACGWATVPRPSVSAPRSARSAPRAGSPPSDRSTAVVTSTATGSRSWRGAARRVQRPIPSSTRPTPRPRRTCCRGPPSTSSRTVLMVINLDWDVAAINEFARILIATS